MAAFSQSLAEGGGGEGQGGNDASGECRNDAIVTYRVGRLLPVTIGDTGTRARLVFEMRSGSRTRGTGDSRGRSTRGRKLKQTWAVDEAKSFLIGDGKSDLQAAAGAGIAGHLFSGGNQLDFVRKLVPARRRIPGSD